MTSDIWKTVYSKYGKHRKKCLICGKLLKDGEVVIGEKTVEEKYYPLKGIMKFKKYHFYHETCHDEKVRINA
jgi:hypothetical protein